MRSLIGILSAQQLRDPMRQFARFLVVGVGNTAVSFGAYRLLLFTNTPYLVAAPIAFAAGAVNGYVFNRRWTFAARDTARSRLLYILVQVAGAGCTSALVLFFVHLTSVGKVWAYLVAAPPVTVGMFLANRLWTFAEPTRPSA